MHWCSIGRSGLSARLLAVTVFVLLTCAPVWAQTRSSVIGTIADAQAGVLPGVSVVLQSPDMVGGTQTFITDDNGVYRFTDLPPGTYQVTASLQGFRTLARAGLRLPFATTITVDFKLEVGGVTESVTVERTTPAVDVTTALVTTRVDKDMLQNLPLYPDLGDIKWLYSLSPGTVMSTSFGGPTGGSTTKLEGQDMQMDAVAIGANWLEEVSVVGLGANAEYGEFDGVTANYVVKSGSNNFHGMADYRTTRPNWVADNMDSLSPIIRERLTKPKIFSRYDFGVQFGGPIIKDKFFFFGALQQFYKETQPINAIAPSTENWPRSIEKVNWAVSKSVKAELMHSYNRRDREGWAGNVTREAGSVSNSPTHFWNVRLTWAPNTKSLLELRTGGQDYVVDTYPMGPNTKAGPPPRRDSVTGISSVNIASWSHYLQPRKSFGATLTHYADKLAGSHVLKFGTDIQDQSETTVSGFPGGMSFTDRSGVPDQVTIRADTSSESIGKRRVLFAMDDWKVNDRLTLQPGLRFVVNRGSTPTSGTVVRANMLEPRLGMAWDVGQDHKTVVRAQWGRFHQHIFTTAWSFMDTAGGATTITSRVLADGSFQELNRVTPQQTSFIDPNFTFPTLNQFFAGVEREIFPEVSLRVTYIRRDFQNYYAFIDTGSVYAPVEMRDPGPDNVAGTPDDGAMVTVFALQNPGNSHFVQTNPSDADWKYDAVEVVAQKRFSNNWQFMASYIRSTSRGLANNTNPSATIGTSGIWANPNTRINAGGRSGLDHPNEASLKATYHSNLLGGFNVSGAWTYSGGYAWSRTATFQLPQGNVTVRTAQRGAEQAAANNQLDVRIEKSFDLGTSSRKVSAFVEIFNLPNLGFAPPLGYIEASGATFGQPSNWVDGRLITAGARIMF